MCEEPEVVQGKSQLEFSLLVLTVSVKAGGQGRAGQLLTQNDNRNSYLSAHIIAVLVGLMISSHKNPPMRFSKS